MKTLYIHIGTPKTGTTAIQHFCRDNAQVLDNKGFYYPKATKKYPSVSLVRNGHFLSGYVQGVKPDISENIKIIDAGMNKIKELFENHDNIILSDESIWRTSSYEHDFLWEMLHEYSVRDGYQIKIIVYLRRQDDYLMSIWNQMVKYTGETKTWDEYFNKRKSSKVFNYYKKLQEMEQSFGKDNLIVRRFERQRFVNGSILEDFLRAIGLEWSDKFIINKQEHNTNLSGNSHEIQRMINKMNTISLEEKRVLSKLLQNCPLVSKNRYKFSLMSKQERESFLALFRESNEKIAEEYICDGDPMYNYDVPDLPKWEKNNTFFEDDLLYFNAYVIKEFNNDLKQKNNGNNRISRVISKVKRFFTRK